MTPRFLARVAEVVFDHVTADAALFRALDGRGNTLFEAAKGPRGTIGEALVGRALEIGRPVLVRDAFAEPLFADLELGGDGRRFGLLSYPWTAGSRPGGVVLLARDGADRPFDRDDLEFLALTLAPVLYLQKRNGNGRVAGDPASAPAGSGTGPGPGSPSTAAFLGDAPAVRRVRAMIEKVRDADAPVFLAGESGTGKELAARTIHETGRRRGGPFVAVNCAAIPEALLESELFGHARGSFTGAVRDKAGLVEEANGGTFFLDEIGDLPLSLQSKLLRVLEEKRVRRVGETRSRPVDARIVSATNKDLDREVERGRFRQDLYFRLKIIAIELPPLRDRPEDVRSLLDHFLDEYARSMGRPRPFLAPVALEMLLRYPWPGNVRELQNEVQRCLIMADGGTLVLEEYLSPKINPEGQTYSRDSHRLAEARADFERRFLREALVRCRFHRTRTAAEVGLTRQGLFKLLKKHGLETRPRPSL